MTGRRKIQPLPPIPDLRFEQSYRRAISVANGSPFWTTFITIRDQVLMPFTQGFLWAIIVLGYRFWGTKSAASGSLWGGRYSSTLPSCAISDDIYFYRKLPTLVDEHGEEMIDCLC